MWRISFNISRVYTSAGKALFLQGLYSTLGKIYLVVLRIVTAVITVIVIIVILFTTFAIFHGVAIVFAHLPMLHLIVVLFFHLFIQVLGALRVKVLQAY